MSVLNSIRRLRSGSSSKGQSLVEFALVLPMLLVLLLGVADFARVFSAGIVLEASARNGAEVAALERLRSEPDSVGDPDYYEGLHVLAANAACNEARRLPTFDGADSCPDGSHDDDGNTSWFVRVCVHDDADPFCGIPVPGYTAALPTSECADTKRLMTNDVPLNAASYFVEVRLCYKFETLFNLDVSLPMDAGLSLGDVWLQRTRTFVIDCQVGGDPEDLAANCPNPPNP